jgi:tetratricopeptide (TPR) repeat protein
MIQQAFISGQIGQVIYTENDRYFVLHAEHPEEPVECRPMDISTFFNYGAEFTTLSGPRLDLAHIKSQLETQRQAYRALTFIIAGMDEELDYESRAGAIEAAERLIKEEATHWMVSARMLARPLPGEADIEFAVDIAIRSDCTSVGILYQKIIDSELAIIFLNETWLEAVPEYFPSDDEQFEFERTLIDLGGFAEMGSALATHNLNALNSVVVKYGQRPELNSKPRQGLFILNDLRTRLTNKWSVALTKSKTRKKDLRSIIEPEQIAEDSDQTHEIRAAFKHRRENPRSRTFSADEAKNKVDHQIEAISQLIERGNISRADRYLRDLINFHLEHSEREHLGMSLCSLAKVAIDANAFELAEKMVDYALALGIEDAVISNTQAQMFKKMGRLGEALATYEETIARFPNNEVARGGYAEVLKATGRFDEALAAYEEAMKRFPNNEVMCDGYAEVLKATGRFDEALATYEETMLRFPNNEVARGGYAEVLKAMGRFDEALATYEETMLRFPNNEVARSGYAEVLKATGRFDEALAAYEEAMKRFPNDEVARGGYAEVLKATGRFDEALAAYEEAMKRFPNNEVMCDGYAEVLKATGRFDEALAAYEEAMERFPNDEVARGGYAEVLKATGRFDEALAAYEEAMKRFPNNEVMCDGYAEVLKATGRFDEALAAYEEAMERFPSNRVARTGYASVLMLMNKFEEVRALLSRTQFSSKDDWIDYHIIAMSYLKSGDADEAIERLAYGLENIRWPEVKNYFATALSVARIKKKQFAEVLDILPSNVVYVDFSQRQTHLALIGHSQAALGKHEEAAQTLAQLEQATNPHIINLKNAIARRFSLGQQSETSLSAVETSALDTVIEEEEFFLAVAA